MSSPQDATGLERPERVFILSGPSGVGKNTLAERLCEEGTAVRAVTATSREPREGEEDGVDYYFVSEHEFRRWLREGRLLEHNVYGGNYYGTPAFSINRAAQEGKPVLLVIDVNGALEIKRRWPGVHLFFIAPPDEEALERRLRGRGEEDEQSVQFRLQRAREEMELAQRYDETVVNDRIEDAVAELRDLIRDEI
mgnify:CR=1 FL=1